MQIEKCWANAALTFFVAQVCAIIRAVRSWPSRMALEEIEHGIAKHRVKLLPCSYPFERLPPLLI